MFNKLKCPLHLRSYTGSSKEISYCSRPQGTGKMQQQLQCLSDSDSFGSWDKHLGVMNQCWELPLFSPILMAGNYVQKIDPRNKPEKARFKSQLCCSLFSPFVTQHFCIFLKCFFREISNLRGNARNTLGKLQRAFLKLNEGMDNSRYSPNTASLPFNVSFPRAAGQPQGYFNSTGFPKGGIRIFPMEKNLALVIVLFNRTVQRCQHPKKLFPKKSIRLPYCSQSAGYIPTTISLVPTMLHKDPYIPQVVQVTITTTHSSKTNTQQSLPPASPTPSSTAR